MSSAELEGGAGNGASGKPSNGRHTIEIRLSRESLDLGFIGSHSLSLWCKHFVSGLGNLVKARENGRETAPQQKTTGQSAVNRPARQTTAPSS